MAVQIVYETHSTTEDNEAGRATGWLPGRLSEEGHRNAVALGQRRRNDGIDAVFCSDLARARETVAIAFEGMSIPILLDWRLRECDYGDQNGGPVATMHPERDTHLDVPYPNGESWREAVDRVIGFVDTLPARWDGKRILVVGHVATRWGLDCRLGGRRLEDLMAEDFAWQEGWEHRLER